MTRGTWALAALVVLAACKGPAQKAGEEKDKQAAATAGVAYDGSGPNEAIGRRQDQAADAAHDAGEANARALRREGDAVRDRAKVNAERLEQQAKAIRRAADDQADALDTRAKQAAATKP
ncbi:hypothetical protein [Sphingomonas sp.]|uniref:hypothetical protein n=1 Tax=Sphingomonas sp. TaxID=28214 RepID=UPI003AFFFFE4